MCSRTIIFKQSKYIQGKKLENLTTIITNKKMKFENLEERLD